MSTRVTEQAQRGVKAELQCLEASLQIPHQEAKTSRATAEPRGVSVGWNDPERHSGNFEQFHT